MPVMPRVSAAALVVALAAQTGCGSLSTNQSKGLMYGGGAAVFMGAVVMIDGLACDEIAGGAMSCDEDKADLYGGLAVMSVGLVLGALGYLMRPQDKAEGTATSTTKPAPAPVTALQPVTE